ncbi:MAG: hypothetical protein WKF67_01635 [Rubrobacteraceae bacterium]
MDLESRTIETASVNTIRALGMEAVGKAASGMVTQTGPEPSRAERFLAGSLAHPDAREAAK